MKWMRSSHIRRMKFQVHNCHMRETRELTNNSLFCKVKNYTNTFRQVSPCHLWSGRSPIHWPMVLKWRAKGQSFIRFNRWKLGHTPRWNVRKTRKLRRNQQLQRTNSSNSRANWACYSGGVIVRTLLQISEIQAICTVKGRNVLKTHCGDNFSLSTEINDHVIKCEMLTTDNPF